MQFTGLLGPGHMVLYVVSFMCLMGILMTRVYSRSTMIINLVLFATYSIMLYYKIFTKSEQKYTIVWGFYLAVLSMVHILFTIIYMIVQYRISKRQD